MQVLLPPDAPRAELGPLPDEVVLVDAGNGPAACGGAVEPEPLPLDRSLWDAPNVPISPHVASSTVRWRGRADRFAGDQILRDAAGQALLNVRGEY